MTEDYDDEHATTLEDFKNEVFFVKKVDTSLHCWCF